MHHAFHRTAFNRTAFNRTTLCMTVLLATTLLSGAVSAQPAETPPHDYFFGDSDLEQGNFQIIAGQTEADRAPYYCAGGLCRDSNGPVWPELIHPGVQADHAATPDAPALNFAVSGAHMTDRGDPDLPVPTGVETQIARFAALQDGGAVTVRPQDRFFIHAGSNDLIRLLQGDAPELVQSQVVEAATANVRELADRGARTIVIAHVQPVQYLPFLGGADREGLRATLGTFISDTNRALKGSLETLKPLLPAGTRIVLMDQTAFFERVRSQYRQLGFTTVDTPCYDAEAGTLCATDPEAQNRHLFFDTNHFTAAGHRLLADWYRATLDAASGEASRAAGRITDVLLDHGDRVRAEMMAARAVMGTSTQRGFLFAAPFASHGRLDSDGARTGLRLRQRGGLFGVQLPVGSFGFAGLAMAGVDDKARVGTTSGFTVREWSANPFAGVDLGAARLSIQGSYARSTIKDFSRDTGALGVIAHGRTRGERWSVGGEFAGERRLGRVRLQSRTGLTYMQATVGGFSESGADGLALLYERQRAEQVTLDTDLKASVLALEGQGPIAIRPFIHLRDSRRLSGGTHDVRSILIDNVADAASIRTAATTGDRLEIGGGMDARLGRALSIELAYDRSVTGVERGGALTLRLVTSL